MQIRGQKFENETDDTDMSNLSTETTKKLNNYKKNKESKNVKHITPRDIPVEYSISTAKDYDTYSNEDSSNDRFMTGQKNQYEAIKNSINMVSALKENELNNDNNIINSVVGIEHTLFDNTVENENTESNINKNTITTKITVPDDVNNNKKERSIAEILDVKSNDEYASDYVNMDKFDTLIGEDGLCPF